MALSHSYSSLAESLSALFSSELNKNSFENRHVDKKKKSSQNWIKVNFLVKCLMPLVRRKTEKKDYDIKSFSVNSIELEIFIKIDKIKIYFYVQFKKKKKVVVKFYIIESFLQKTL